MVVTRRYGAGVVLYLGTDELWRWRYKVADTWHQRIWNQVARYAMPRPFAVSRAGIVKTTVTAIATVGM